MKVRDILRRMDGEQKVEIYDHANKRLLREFNLPTCSFLLGFDVVCIDEEDERIRNLLNAEVINIKPNRTFDFIGLTVEEVKENEK